MIDSRQGIIKDPVYNYRRLEPIPKNEELAEFYQSKYYNLIAEGGQAPELRLFNNVIVKQAGRFLKVGKAYIITKLGRARRGVSGALNLQSAIAGLNSCPRFFSLRSGLCKRR